MNKKKFTIVACLVLTLTLISACWSAPVDSFFDVFTELQWKEALETGHIKAMTAPQWDRYMQQWEAHLVEGNRYPDNQFFPPELSVFGGDANLEPGLVMAWGDPALGDPVNPSSQSSAFLYDYLADPDLSNSTICVTVVPPQFNTSGDQINAVSLGLRDVNGNIRAWYWNVGAVPGPGMLQVGVPTLVQIDTSIVGVTAGTPNAASYANNPAFDLTQVLQIIVDENAVWVGEPAPVPPPGTVNPRPWNYWYDLAVKPNPSNPGGIQAGVNIDIHQDTNMGPSGGPGEDPTLNPNDFHIEGWIESGDPAGNWGQPPILLSHVDDIFPNFSHTIVGQVYPPHPLMENWYYFKADWSLDPTQPGIEYCTELHLGLLFEVTCHNIVIDLTGWWTRDGERIPETTLNNGFVPIVGFDVQDNVIPDLGQTTLPQRVRVQNGNNNGQQELSEVPVEMVSLSLVSMDPVQVRELLGDMPFHELREGGRGENLPFVPVENMQGIINEDDNPSDFPADSFFDIFTELSVGDPIGPRDVVEFAPVTPVHIAAGDFVVIRERIRFQNNSGQQDLRWVWHWHQAHPGLFDLGDAPDSTNTWGAPMTAYPWGVPARYPTVFAAGSPPHGPIHFRPLDVAFLGRAVTLETEADIGPDQDPTNNIEPPADTKDLDRADDGVLNLPLSLPSCTLTRFQYEVTVVTSVEKLFVNVWFDYDRDGDWDDTFDCPATGTILLSEEHAVKDQVLANLPVGTHTITTPPFLPHLPTGYSPKRPIWMRITLSGQPWTGSPPPLGGPGIGGSGPTSGYVIGETEDYIFRPRQIPCTDCPDFNGDGVVNLIDFAWFANFYLKFCVQN